MNQKLKRQSRNSFRKKPVEGPTMKMKRMWQVNKIKGKQDTQSCV